MRPLTNRDAERLRSIHTYTQLIKYLRDELEWPFYEFDDPDEVSFEWSLDELGIAPEHAARIQEVRQLRPPTGDWPWGIFYVKFEKKHLPITILRRALSRLVTKQRASANSGQRWDLEDLLFISSFGEGEQRQISFARFQAPAEGGNRLPELKVLAWDADDRDLSLQHTASVLREKLAWPEDEGDFQAWREQWSGAFVRGHRETIRTSKALASRLAELAQAIRGRIERTIRLETEDGPLRGLMESFRGSLVHDLDEAGFANMYAQTIAYGLFSARATHPDQVDAGSLLSVPVTNPFLRELLGTFLQVGGRTEGGVGIDFDELGVNEVVDQLNDTDIEAVLRDFDDKNPLEDPVIHFFEGFLGEYDPEIKKERGVFYTPRPVVSFIVRSVDELLRTEFGLEDGLADTTTWGEMAGRIDDLKIPEGATETQAFVQILDPATGTGTFLVEVIDLIHATMTAKWQAAGHAEREIKELWNAYVPEHLLPRLHGFELMMAPYAIAHMKIGLKLHETGYLFERDQRAQIFLTNALEPAEDSSGTLDFALPALAHEAEAVNAIKRYRRFTAVLGNPPYSKKSGNLSDDAIALVEPFRFVDGEKIVERGALAHEINLQDDYVKFFGLASKLIDLSSSGVVAFITNSTYLGSRSLRGMRQFLAGMLPTLYAVDLGGRVAGDVDGDGNVFEISLGVGVLVGATRNISGQDALRFARFRGDRKSKYEALLEATAPALESSQIHIAPPFYRFDEVGSPLRSDYLKWPTLSEIMPANSSCLITSRDNLLVGFDRKGVLAKVQSFAAADVVDVELQRELGFGVKAKWDANASLRKIKSEGVQESKLVRLYYRPFDVRWLYYDEHMIDAPIRPMARHIKRGEAVTLLTPAVKTTSLFSHALVCEALPEKKCCSHDRSTQLFPATIRPEGLFGERIPNAAGSVPEWLRQSSDKTTSTRLLDYVYAILYAPSYRSNFGAFLRDELPRIPLPISGNYGLFNALISLGGRLIELHLLDYQSADSVSPLAVGLRGFQIEKVSYSDGAVWIDKTKTRGFTGVPEEVWNFNIGGYQVCEKWLKERGPKKGNPGRVLTDEDIEHYQKIVVALAETIRIMAEIDEVIEAYGGWPGAFVTEASASDHDADLGGASMAAEGPG